MPQLKLTLQNFNDDLAKKVQEQTQNIDNLTKSIDSKNLQILDLSKSLDTVTKNEQKAREDSRVMTAKIQLLEKDVLNKDLN